MAPHVVFEESGQVFKLTAGRSMYAMRVSEGGGLEHLYWGPALPDGTDLRYITRSNVAQPFDPTVSHKEVMLAPQHQVGDQLANTPTDPLAEALSLRTDPLTLWRTHRGAADGEQAMKASHADHATTADSIYERRLENISWRLLHLHATEPVDQSKVASKVIASSPRVVRRGHGGVQAQAAGWNPEGTIRRAGTSFVSLRGGSLGRGAAKPPMSEELSTPWGGGDVGVAANLAAGADTGMGGVGGPVGADQAVPSLALLALDLPTSDLGLLQSLRSQVAAPADRLASLRRGGAAGSSRSSSVSASLTNATAFGGLTNTSQSRSSSCRVDSRDSTGSGGLAALLDAESDEYYYHDQWQQQQLQMQQQQQQRVGGRGGMASPIVNQPQMEIGERVGKNMRLLEISDMGTGDYRQPSLIVEYSLDGSTISPLTYVSHRIIEGKAPVPSPMPHVRPHPAPPHVPSSDANGGAAKGATKEKKPAAQPPVAATTLVVTLKDVHTGLSVDAHFTAMHHLEVIVRRLVVRNTTSNVVRLKRCMSATVDFDIPLHGHWLTQLDGSWARERHVTNRKLDQGVTSFGSQRGTSSHQHSPFFAISEGHAPPEEEHGHVYGFALVYSGSFLAECEVVDVGRLRCNLGLQTQGFTWHLEPSDEFSSPECALAFSARGLGRLSRQLHALVREHVIPPAWRHEPCPVLCNTWEAEYFNVSHDSVVASAPSLCTRARSHLSAPCRQRALPFPLPAARTPVLGEIP